MEKLQKDKSDKKISIELFKDLLNYVYNESKTKPVEINISQQSNNVLSDVYEKWKNRK